MHQNFHPVYLNPLAKSPLPQPIKIMHEENFNQVQQLIALKNHEQPDNAYFEEFLDEFHRRQRQDLLQRSSRSLFFERINTWFTGMNKWNLVYGAGAAYAAIALSVILVPKDTESHAQTPLLQTVPVKHEVQKDMLYYDEAKEPMHGIY